MPLTTRGDDDTHSSSGEVDGSAGPAADPLVRPRPWWVWAAPFAAMLTVLLVRNAFLFSRPEYESADMAANSILIEQARRFTLLVGNYSREGFNHPGPAFLYVESWGESIFWALLRVVPTPWNGQLIGLYLLNAAFAACVVAVVYGWTRSARGVLAAGAVLALFGLLHPAVFNSDWMPYVYVPAFLAFVVSLASASAGRSADAWIATLSGWFLIHGHAAFLVLVPAMVAVPVAVRRREFMRALRTRRRVWLPVVVISAAFALPLILQWALIGPGNFEAYLAYQSGGQAGGHSLAQVAGYVLWFWWPHANAWAAPLILALAAGLLTGRLPSGPARRFCCSLLIFDALSVAAVAGYVVVGVDEVNQYYICYVSWVNPVVLVLVSVIAMAELIALAGRGKAAGAGIRLARAARWPGRAGLAVTAAAAVAAWWAFAVAPATQLTTVSVDPENPRAGFSTDAMLPAGVAAMGARAAGRTIVLTFPHSAWPTVTGILVQAERTGVRACVADRHWKFMMTSQFICTPAQLAGGYQMSVYPTGEQPRGVTAVARFPGAVAAASGARMQPNDLNRHQLALHDDLSPTIVTT